LVMKGGLHVKEKRQSEKGGKGSGVLKKAPDVKSKGRNSMGFGTRAERQESASGKTPKKKTERNGKAKGERAEWGSK